MTDGFDPYNPRGPYPGSYREAERIVDAMRAEISYLKEALRRSEISHMTFAPPRQSPVNELKPAAPAKPRSKLLLIN